ncbi:uncharacterized protein LOC144427369 isoform X2 [Styela clava]
MFSMKEERVKMQRMETRRDEREQQQEREKERKFELEKIKLENKRQLDKQVEDNRHKEAKIEKAMKMQSETWQAHVTLCLDRGLSSNEAIERSKYILEAAPRVLKAITDEDETDAE